ncbi:MAG TPA: hypothetical protein VHE12_12755 [bacterium]|nr:hypothetical protein [bacterium]
MNWFPLIFSSFFYLLISTLLVFLFSFFVPSLGHLEDLGIGSEVVHLDLLAPWGMVLSAVSISLLVRASQGIGIQGKGVLNNFQPLLYFTGMWVERTCYIVRDHGTSAILAPLFLSALWIPLFLWVASAYSGEALAHEEWEGEKRPGWGILFFWTAVFFSFAVQLTLGGYGAWGAVQGLAFLGMSYLEFRKLRESGLLEGAVGTGFRWIYLTTLVLFVGFYVANHLGVL